MTIVTPGTDSLPMGKYGEVRVVARNIWKRYQAVAIQVNTATTGVFGGAEVLPTDNETAPLVYWANIRQLIVLGRPANGKLVQLTDDETATGGFVYDPDNYAKLVDTNFGFPSVKITDDLGEVSDQIAEAVGRHELKSLLERGNVREYIFTNEITTVPLPFQTVDFADGFSGVVLSVNMSMKGGQEVITITAMDLT